MNSNEDFSDDNLSTEEKMLVFMLRQCDLPIKNIFTSIYEAYDIADKEIV